MSENLTELEFRQALSSLIKEVSDEGNNIIHKFSVKTISGDKAYMEMSQIFSNAKADLDKLMKNTERPEKYTDKSHWFYR